MSAAGDPGPGGEPAGLRDLGFRDRWLRRNRVIHLLYRTAVALIGLVVVGVGLALVPLPGPGWLIVFLGLAILASEFAWAARLLGLARRHLGAWTAWLGRQPALVRGLLGAATLAGVAIVVAVSARVWGLPGWVPLV